MRPMGLKEIVKETDLKIRSANMHLLGLRRAGYVFTPEKGSYLLTDSGKEMIGFPRVDEELARKILRKLPPRNAFYFYLDIGKPLGINSDSLDDFCEKIRSINVNSIEFHVARGDFELWVHFLGDVELAKRLRGIKEAGLSGEVLRDKIHEIVKARCEELRKYLSP